jgi:hypothetical protein
MRVFFFRKGVIIWGIVLLAIIIILMIILRLTNSDVETLKRGLTVIANTV